MIMNDLRKQIVEEARTYLGTPFHHQGRLKGIGVDCIGLLIGVGKKLGLITYDYIAYSRYPDGVTLRREISREFIEINIRDVKVGDIWLYWLDKKSKAPQHVGIITDYGFVHTYADVGKVVEHRLTKAWKKRIVAAFRYPGVGD